MAAVMSIFRAIALLGIVSALLAALPGPVMADLRGHGGMVRAIDFSPDGRRVLTGSFDFTAVLWDFEEQREIGRLDEHAGPVTSVAFLPDGRRALTTSDDMTAILWDLTSLKPLHHLRAHKHKVMTVAVAADGRIAATGGWDKTICIWNLATGGLIRTIRQPTPINTLTFIGASRLLAAGGHDPVIRIVNADTGRYKGNLEGHRMGITQLNASTDGKRLLSASIDKTMRLWDMETFGEIQTYERHDNQLFTAVFAPDGKTALSAGRDGYLIQWNLDQGEPIRQIKAHGTIVWAADFSPDGRFAVSASSDETARVWHLETGDQIGAEPDDPDEPKPWLTSNHPGAPLFKKCARCHSLSASGTRRSGPHLSGLFGRPAGSIPGYNYSSALTKVDFLWNAKTLFQLFDEGPDKFLPGTKMPVQRVPDTEQLSQLIEYLKELTATDQN